MIEITPVIEFYITNECNLSCTNCNRFNDYKFSGHYYWHDYATLIEKWSRRVTAPNIVIIGGEPTQHPELEVWISNLRDLWPKANLMIQTNGVSNLYREKDRIWSEYNAAFGVAVHDLNMKDKLKEKWEPYRFDDVSLFDASKFTESTVVRDSNRLRVHRSQPDIAFRNCTMKVSHTMFKGHLYKCPVTAVLPEFMKQHRVDLDADQQSLLDQYQPLDPDCTDQELVDFVINQNQHIDQCALCPQQATWSPVTFQRKK